MDMKQRNEEIRKGIGITILVIIFVFFVKSVMDGEYSNDSNTRTIRIEQR
jgi:hypothetical protein